MKRVDDLFHRAAIIALVIVELLAICLAVALAATIAAALLAPQAAEAAVDDFGRPWFGTVALSACPAADQFVGVQFAQVRRGLPGVWIDARAGGGRQSAFGGIAVQIASGVALRAGAGVDALDDDLNVGIAGGATVAWRRLSGHVGLDSATDALSCGVGVTFWR